MLTVIDEGQIAAHQLEFNEFLKFGDKCDISNLLSDDVEMSDAEDSNGCCVHSGLIIADCSMEQMW